MAYCNHGFDGHSPRFVLAFASQDRPYEIPINVHVPGAHEKILRESVRKEKPRTLWPALSAKVRYIVRSTMDKTELRRELGLFDSISIVLGIVIGSGIFLVPSLIARALDSGVDSHGVDRHGRAFVFWRAGIR